MRSTSSREEIENSNIEKRIIIMRKKTDPWSPTRFLKRQVSLFLMLECAGIAASYILYRKLNHNPEFRYTLYSSQYSSFNSIVEGYYKLGETLNSESQIRQLDQELWKKEGKTV